AAEDLPDGPFGFEFWRGRSFAVDNVLIESFSAQQPLSEANRKRDQEQKKRKAEFDQQIKDLEAQRLPQPEQLAIVTDRGSQPPQGRLLERGDYLSPGEMVSAVPPAMLCQGEPSELPSSTE